MKPRIKSLIDWYKNELEKENVEIRLKTKATPEVIRKEAPDVVIIATGSEPLIPKIPGIENAILAEDVLAGKARVGNSVAIIGGGLVGCELALELAKEGKKVTLIEALPEVAMGEATLNKIAIVKLLNERKSKRSY